MSAPKRLLRPLVAVLVAALAASSSSPASAPPPVSAPAEAAVPARAPALRPPCSGGYAYAGLLSATRARGVRAALTALSRPRVANGHVAAWVGLGGAGQGPGGTDAWVQVGLSAFPGSGSRLYYEVARPGRAPRYVELATGIRAGARFRVAVAEIAGRPDYWRVWVNGKPVSAPVQLRGSSGRWRPLATAESWAGDGSACNRFRYRFENVRVAAADGSWRPFVGASAFLDSGYRLLDRGGSAFVAASA